ncbi:MAG: hypothetical protein V2I67_07310 [Thermoanaerobaculales bacterium]|jgi:hypothetical protein|nr:hypothetical protein [Thermoanaerobaculales bacterium]
MLRKGLVLCSAVLFSLPLIAAGTELSGELLYDDLPFADVFPDVASSLMFANPWSGGDQIEGTVDLTTSTYHVSGLTSGRWGITVYLERRGSPGNVGDGGDLQAYTNIDIDDADPTVEEDMEVKHNVHVISPIDSDADLNGSGHDCTHHPAVPYPITYAVEPVPRAVSYTFKASLELCPGGSVGWFETTSDHPSTVIPFGTANEDFQNPWVTCLGASGADLCAGPTFRYTDAHVWGLFLRNSSDQHRGIHLTDTLVVPAVASAGGAQGTYWSSAVTLTNLADTDQHIDITYTPRGENGLETYSQETVVIDALSQITWADILGELFSTTGAGSLEIRGQELAVVSRTSTPAANSGSYGQGIPPVQPEQVLSNTGTTAAVVGGVEQGSAWRTNLGLCEVWGEGVTVRVTVMDELMAELGSKDYTLRPFENIQVNEVATKVGGTSSLVNGAVEVAVISGNGRAAAYISVVDNGTGDPTFVAVAPQFPSGS